MTAALCGNGGCVRIAGHAGVCTRQPTPAAVAWDHARAVLAALDWPTPPWAT